MKPKLKCFENNKFIFIISFICILPFLLCLVFLQFHYLGIERRRNASVLKKTKTCNYSCKHKLQSAILSNRFIDKTFRK